MDRSASESRAGWVGIAIVAIAVIVAAAIILDLGPFADGALSEKEFVAQGDEICAQAHQDFSELQDEPPRTAVEAQELTEELLAISRDELDAVAELDSPASLDGAAERYLAARERGIELISDGLDAAEEGDATTYERAQAELASGQLERLELAERVGFSECSQILFGREQLERDAQPPPQTDPGAPPTVANPPTGAP